MTLPSRRPIAPADLEVKRRRRELVPICQMLPAAREWLHGRDVEPSTVNLVANLNESQ